MYYEFGMGHMMSLADEGQRVARNLIKRAEAAVADAKEREKSATGQASSLLE